MDLLERRGWGFLVFRSINFGGLIRKRLGFWVFFFVIGFIYIFWVSLEEGGDLVIVF